MKTMIANENEKYGGIANWKGAGIRALPASRNGRIAIIG